MDVKRLAVLGIAALAAFYVIVDPAEAARVTQSALGMLAGVANGLFAFVQEFFAGL